MGSEYIPTFRYYIFLLSTLRSSRPEIFSKKGVLKISQNSQENTCARGLQLKKKETLAQVFSCEFCEIFKYTFLHGTPPVAASKL